MLIALQFYASGVLLQVIDDTTGVDKSTVSRALHNTDAMFETIHSAYSREIALWDTNCRLARHYKWFLNHVLTVNQGLTKAIPIKCFVSHRPTDPCFWKSEKKNSESLVKEQVL